MAKFVSCGFIVAELRGWLLCHVTRSGDRWDFPKGKAEIDESDLQAAIRELREETGLELNQLDRFVDLGRHGYQREKDLHLFYVNVPLVEVEKLHCDTLVIGRDYPEMDGFELVPSAKAVERLGPRMQEYVKAYLPKDLL